VESYVEKFIKSMWNSNDTMNTELEVDYGVLQSNIDAFKESIDEFNISDDFFFMACQIWTTYLILGFVCQRW
jgi:hypothetical protein